MAEHFECLLILLYCVCVGGGGGGGEGVACVRGASVCET